MLCSIEMFRARSIISEQFNSNAIKNGTKRGETNKIWAWNPRVSEYWNKIIKQSTRRHQHHRSINLEWVSSDTQLANLKNLNLAFYSALQNFALSLIALQACVQLWKWHSANCRRISSHECNKLFGWWSEKKDNKIMTNNEDVNRPSLWHRLEQAVH